VWVTFKKRNCPNSNLSQLRKIRDVLLQMHNEKLIRVEKAKLNLLHLLSKDYLKYYNEVVGLAVVLWCEEE